jgi:hypothetical protein
MLGKPTIPKGGRCQKQPRSARQMDMFTGFAVDAAASLPRWTDLPQNAQAALIGLMTQLMLDHAQAFKMEEVCDDL